LDLEELEAPVAFKNRPVVKSLKARGRIWL
jgi:hypothetical protein